MENHTIEAFAVTSIPHEMRNKGITFKNRAIVEADPYLKRINQTFSILSYASSYEAFLHVLIAQQLSKRDHLTLEQEEILNYIKIESTKRIPLSLKSIDIKVNLLEKLYRLKTNTLKTAEFKAFYNGVIELRNKVVNFTHTIHSEVHARCYDEMSKIGDILLVKACESLCKELQVELPSYYQQYEPLDSAM